MRSQKIPSRARVVKKGEGKVIAPRKGPKTVDEHFANGSLSFFFLPPPLDSSFPLSFSLHLVSRFFFFLFAPLSSVRVAMEAVHHRCVSSLSPILSPLHSYRFPFHSYVLLPLGLRAAPCRIFLPTSQSVEPSVTVRFPPCWKKPLSSSFQLEGERAAPSTYPSRSPRRFKLLMSIFRLVRLSELVHRRRCVLPIKVFNESGRKMAPARPR